MDFLDSLEFLDRVWYGLVWFFRGEGGWGGMFGNILGGGGGGGGGIFAITVSTQVQTS